MVPLAPAAVPNRPRIRIGHGRDDLDAVAVRLAADYPEMSAGSVLRCVLRAAHGLRMTGASRARMAAEVERISRRLLERRTHA